MNTATNKLTTIIAADDQISKQMDQIAANAEDKLGHLAKSGQGSLSLLSSAFGSLGIVGQLALRVLSSAFSALGRIIGEVFQRIAMAATVAFAAATAAAEEFFRRSIKHALELQGSYVALAMTGKSLGIPGSKLEATVQELRKIGIEWGAATLGLTKWLQAGLPLDKVSAMARAAQNTAKFFGKISSDVFTEFLEAIQAGDTMTLHKYGMVAPISQVISKYAPPQYRNMPIEKLPEQVRFAAMLAYIMDKTAMMAGAYETSLGRAVGLWATMVRHVQEVELFFGILGLGALLKVIQWASDFIVKLKEMTEAGHGIAAPMIMVSAIITALVGKFGNAEQAAKKVSDWMDKAFSASKAATFTRYIMYAVGAFHILLGVLMMIEQHLLTAAGAVMLLMAPLLLPKMGLKAFLAVFDDLRKTHDKLIPAISKQFTLGRAAFEGAGTAGEKAKAAYGTAEGAAMQAMRDLKKVMDDAKGATQDNTEAQNAATSAAKEVKPFGGGERFQRYSGMFAQRHAPITVNVHGSAAYGNGAADMASALGDAMSRRLAGAMGTGLSGAGA